MAREAQQVVRRTRRRLPSFVVLAALAAAALPRAPDAHEIPSDVTVQIIVAPAGDRLHVLVRAPLEAMQDVQFPTVGPGYLDVPRADAALRNAAMLWLADAIELYENGRRLARPRLVAARARARAAGRPQARR